MTDQIVRLTGLQKMMSRQMVASWTDVPQFQLETEVDCAAIIALRKKIPFHPSITAIIVKAVADALLKHPYVNGSWAGDHIIHHDMANIAVAVDTQRGLLAPVIPNVGGRTLEEVHAALGVFKQKSERGNFNQEELTGATFTVSNLGMYRINAFSAIVNAPQAAILAIPRMQGVVTVKEDGTFGIMKIMRPVLSLDHRVVDGASGARFLMDLVAFLEKPEGLKEQQIVE
jgi:pyruvate/2-oxoglutarate dehydrogenase complex dihydrolipoamide acyltransferase (E2) component